jgi:uncharacterized repeat protein (TIGR02543 family)
MFIKLLICFFLFTPLTLKAQNNLISDAENCSSTRPPFAFTIQEAWRSSTGKKVDTRYTPIVGDIDDDGNTEILIAGGWAGQDSLLYVFEGETGAIAGQLFCPGNFYRPDLPAAYSYSSGVLILRRNPTAKPNIFISGRNNILYMYEVQNTTRPLQFNLLWTVNLNVGFAMPVTADLNGDGNAEIVCGKYIIDANTGNLLSTLAYSGGGGIFAHTLQQLFPIVADVDKDGLAEVIVGAEVYKFNSGFTPNPSPWAVCPRYSKDGLNMAADIDLDGNIDIVFASYDNTIDSICEVTVWTPTLGTEIGRFSFKWKNAFSYPFVGDIDGAVVNGKKYPEIVINTAGLLKAYAFNGTNFSLKWDMTHTDTSGGTILTLFDFNLDGVVELVYRDERLLHIFNGSGASPVDATTPITCGSATIVEMPVIADVNGDGSADIIVSGNNPAATNVAGELFVFEGAASKWASCPAVWNQQMYSPLLVNRDLTIPATVQPPDLTFTTVPDANLVQYYNGGPMQAPFISDVTYTPIDVSADPFVINGNIEYLSATSVKLTVTFGNQGLVKLKAGAPIQFYKNDMSNPTNIIGSETLASPLYQDSAVTVTKIFTGLTVMPTRFYVRILDDGTNFPAAGAFSDCNLTNNHKSFGTLELLKTVDNLNACIDGTSIFHVTLINNTGGSIYSNNLQTFYNISLCDSLGNGWQFVYDSVSTGTLSAYNPTTRKLFWTIDSLTPGDTARLLLHAKATNAGSIRNSSWIESVNATPLGKELIEAYVIVNSSQAPPAASISSSNSSICGNVIVLASVPGKSSYQWFRNGLEIDGATNQSFTATVSGNYSVTYFDPPCVSQMSANFYVDATCYHLENDFANVFKDEAVTINVLLNDVLPPTFFNGAFSLCDSIIQQPVQGSVACIGSGVNSRLVYTNSGIDLLTNETDSIIYRFHFIDPNTLSVLTDTATIYIRIVELPDNVNDSVRCLGSPQPADWGIELYKSFGTIHTHQPPLVGDMDGDGFTDIVLMNHKPDYADRGAVPDSVIILKGPEFVNTIKFNVGNTGYTQQSIARIKYSTTLDTTVIFIISASDNKLRCFDYHGHLLWQSATAIFTPTYSSYVNARAIGIADFNNDGWAEVYVGNQIFDAATGYELCNGGNDTKGLVLYSANAHGLFSIAADVLGDKRLELCAGSMVYDVVINSRTNSMLNSMPVICQVQPQFPSGTLLHRDGATVVADFDADGLLDILVQTQESEQSVGTTSTAVGYLYIWNPRTQQMMVMHQLTNAAARNVPFVGDIDGDNKPEIVILTNGASPLMRAFKINGTTLNLFWSLSHSDSSGSTGLTLFDFNEDGIFEIVYRDETRLRVINGSMKSHITGLDTSAVYNLFEMPAYCGTVYEYPTVADIDNDGHAEILTTNAYDSAARASDTRGELLIFKGTNPWAPARPVWNQYMYNVVNVRNDLTIPKTQFNPASFFAGNDGILGNNDDLQPFNNFLQQQTLLNAFGQPLWTIPNAILLDSSYSIVADNDSITVMLCFLNQGDAAIIPPFYATLYKDYINASSVIATDSFNNEVLPGDTGCFSFRLRDSMRTVPLVSYIVRLNDFNGSFPHQQECDYGDSIALQISPFLSELMSKNASLNDISNNGSYPNPVAVLHSEKILYHLKGVNVNVNNGGFTITDTLPKFLKYVDNSRSGDNPDAFEIFTVGSPAQDVLKWSFLNVSPFAQKNVSYEATTQEGANASQPLYINKAWISAPAPDWTANTSDSLRIFTNSTFHQGAGTCLLSFSASAGGTIINAEVQAVEYNSKPRSGIIPAANEGYRFTGWQHEQYLSQRGEIIPAAKGILHYDSLSVFGNIELIANFEPVQYSINYFLNGGYASVENPTFYTIESPDVILVNPTKQGDVFCGWTGSNGASPQLEVEIPHGSTGERIYYAHFIHSGNEDTTPELLPGDAVWAADNQLFVRLRIPNAIVRIYNPDGVLFRQKTILATGISTITLPTGVYIVTVNNNAGHKVIIK